MNSNTGGKVFSFLDAGAYDPEGQGKRIAACRKAKAMTQAALAKKIGVTAAAVSQWETSSTTEIGSFAMQRICEALEVSVRYIMTGKPPMNRAVHLEPEELDLIATFRELQPQAREALVRKAHEYHEIAGPGTPTRVHPVQSRKK